MPKKGGMPFFGRLKFLALFLSSLALGLAVGVRRAQAENSCSPDEVATEVATKVVEVETDQITDYVEQVLEAKKEQSRLFKRVRTLRKTNRVQGFNGASERAYDQQINGIIAYLNEAIVRGHKGATEAAVNRFLPDFLEFESTAQVLIKLEKAIESVRENLKLTPKDVPLQKKLGELLETKKPQSAIFGRQFALCMKVRAYLEEAVTKGTDPTTQKLDASAEAAKSILDRISGSPRNAASEPGALGAVRLDRETLKGLFDRDPDAKNALARLYLRSEAIAGIEIIEFSPEIIRIAQAAITHDPRLSKIVELSELMQWFRDKYYRKLMNEIYTIDRSSFSPAQKLRRVRELILEDKSYLLTLARSLEFSEFWFEIKEEAKAQLAAQPSDWKLKELNDKIAQADSDAQKLGELSMNHSPSGSRILAKGISVGVIMYFMGRGAPWAIAYGQSALVGFQTQIEEEKKKLTHGTK